MELSSVLSNGFHPVSRVYTTRSINNSAEMATTPPPTQHRRVTIPVSSNATATHTQVRSKSTNVSRKTAARQNSKESAIRDIQHSSDLESAIMRSGEVLKAQDLNIILRHFGKVNRWKDVCQVPTDTSVTLFPSPLGYLKVLNMVS